MHFINIKSSNYVSPSIDFSKVLDEMNSIIDSNNLIEPPISFFYFNETEPCFISFPSSSLFLEISTLKDLESSGSISSSEFDIRLSQIINDDDDKIFITYNFSDFL